MFLADKHLLTNASVEEILAIRKKGAQPAQVTVASELCDDSGPDGSDGSDPKDLMGVIQRAFEVDSSAQRTSVLGRKY